MPPVDKTFWSFGAKTLELEVTGMGTDPGPYRISVPLNVVPEPIDATWWTWATPPGGAPGVFTGSWKSGYFVGGSFTNRGLANMTVNANSLSAVEHPTDITGTAQDETITPAVLTVGTVVMPGGSVAATWLRRQAWTWLAQGTFIQVGPRSRTFSYVASFSFTDGFGNTYPIVASSAATATVSVPGVKVTRFEQGTLAVAIGIGLRAIAVLVGQLGGYAWIAAALLAAGGMGYIIGGTLLLYDAYDPPVPDFREHERTAVDPQAWTIPEPDDERLHPLHTLAMLVTRLASARVRAVRIRDRAWAAYLDRAESRLARYRDDARHELETLRRLTSATAAAVDEAYEPFEQLVNGLERVPTLEDVREMAARFADELQLNDIERATIAERLAVVEEGDLREFVEVARSDGLARISESVSTIYDITASEFQEREYLD